MCVGVYACVEACARVLGGQKSASNALELSYRGCESLDLSTENPTWVLFKSNMCS